MCRFAFDNNDSWLKLKKVKRKKEKKNTHDLSLFSIFFFLLFCVYIRSVNMPLAAKRQQWNLLLLCIEWCYRMLTCRALIVQQTKTCWIWNEWMQDERVKRHPACTIWFKLFFFSLVVRSSCFRMAIRRYPINMFIEDWFLFNQHIAVSTA